MFRPRHSVESNSMPAMRIEEIKNDWEVQT